MRLMLALLLIVILPGLVMAQPEKWAANEAIDLKPLLLAAEAKLTKDLHSGRGKGTIVQSFRQVGDEEPESLEERQFEIIFDEERFRIDMLCLVQSLIGDEKREEAEACKQSLLFDGKQHYLLTYEQDGEVAGLIYDQNWTQYLLEKIHFPCPKPNQLWFSAHEFLSGGDFVYRTKSLNQQGIYAYATDARMECKCYFLPPAPYALTRCTLTIRPTTLIEFNIDWKESRGIRYVNRFSSRFVEGRLPVERYSSLEFSHFETNPEIADSELELKALGAPKGTRFTVKVPVPMTYVFNGNELVREVKKK